MMDELLRLRVMLSPDVMTTVRLTTGGVCSLAALSYDDGEDCKVCVTESLLLLLRGGYAAAHVAFTNSGVLRVTVEGEGERGAAAACEEDEIALALINALAQDVVMDKKEGALCAIAFTFGKRA